LSIVELEKVEHLSILSIDDLLIFFPIETTIPNVYQLTIENTITFDMMERLKGYQFKQIRKLTIECNYANNDFIMKGLFYLFPRIDYLIYTSDICSIEMMIHLIDGLVYLLNASFYSNKLFSEFESNYYPNSNWIIQNSHRLVENNFTYRVHHSSSRESSKGSCHWWIAVQVSLSKYNIVFIFSLLCSHYNHLQFLIGHQD